MTSGRNVFAVSRSIWDDSDFAREPFTEREAWIWLVSAAAWKDIKARGNVGPVKLQRGEFSFSTRFLAEKWQWSNSRVDRFIHRVKNRDMIRDTSRDGSKIYSIIKYNHFQVVGLPKRDSDRDDDRDDNGTAAGQQRDKEETVKQDNSKTEQQEPPAIAVDLFPVPRETKSLTVVQSLPDWLPLDAWSAFLEMRRKKRAKPTPHAIDLLLKRLAEMVANGHDPGEILNTSTRSNWTDIYAPKPEKAHGNARKPTAHDNFNAGVAGFIASLGGDADEGGEDQAGPHADAARLPLLAP